MKASEIEEILNAHTKGNLSTTEATEKLKNLSYENIGYARIDHSRSVRQGFPEVVFGQGKTKEQILGIFEKLIQRTPNVLITRTTAEVFGEVRNIYTEAEWHEAARVIRVFRDKTELGTGEIAVVTAGTSDIPVAEEAALTAETMGNRVKRIWDAGVAGIHRILSEREILQNSRVVIVVAGMEGALPSVVGGLVKVPVIAVPTSIGYGASFGGIAALLGMLNSCASNVTVVNIDNGFGAGFVASLINRRFEEEIHHKDTKAQGK
jgi:pyridinium-3,5-biscarboxylic acid mononucleotide synthase